MFLTSFLQPTNWKGPRPDRMKLPRKAAYFTVIAAEAASSARGDGKEQTARDLWLLGSRLYSRKSNPADGGGDYGWATLRAFCFDCLSLQGNCELSLEAAEQLLSLLGELDPEILHAEGSSTKSFTNSDDKRQLTKLNIGGEIDDVSADPVVETKEVPSNRTSTSKDDVDLQEAISSASQFAKNLRASYTNFTTASTLLALQSRWADEDPIPPVHVPLSHSSPLSSCLVSLKAVWPQMDYETCSAAQKRCLDRTALLRRAIPTSSSNADAGFVYGLKKKTLPLYVSSAMALQLETALELECVQREIVPDESKQGAMATFFNPYAKKKAEDTLSARVAEEEERAMLITFGNRLALPLEVRRGQLDFFNNSEGRVKAAVVSFVVPPKATSFVVRFPFTIISRAFSSGESAMEADNCTVFEVKGLDLTCFGRTFSLPIKAFKKAEVDPLSGSLPVSASVYAHRGLPKETEESLLSKPRIETYPCQPKLQICFADTGAPAEAVTVSLSDGEIFSVPTFRLGNYLGPSSKGKIECLEIVCASVPGRKMFDSSVSPFPEETEAEFVHDLIYKTNPAPFKLRALTSPMNISSINDPQDRTSNRSKITFQIAAAYNFEDKLPGGATVEVQFRYRGSCNSKMEVWRKSVVTFHIVPTKGPRISSVVFRPDLADGCVFAETIDRQWALNTADKEKKGGPQKSACLTTDGAFVLNRVGLDSSVSVCNADAFFILAVANETWSVITVKRQGEAAGGFESCPLGELGVSPGVSVKIPIVMPRICRTDMYGDLVDVVAEFVKKTTFVWERHEGGESGPVKSRGYIRIPPSCLTDIINRNPSLLSQICKPPCSIDLVVGEKLIQNSSMNVSMGYPVNLSMKVSLESWVPKHVMDSCSMTMNFRCTRKDRVEGASSDVSHREFVWAGKLQETAQLGGGDATHKAKLVFCSPGQFAVSACARIFRNEPSGGGTGEIWWAPMAQFVIVDEAKQFAQ